MAVWPELDELKQVLDVTSDDWDGDGDYDDPTRLTRLLAAAIAQVKADTGDWDEYADEPDDSLAQAALKMAEILAQTNVAADSDLWVQYRRLLKGHRRRFAVA